MLAFLDYQTELRQRIDAVLLNALPSVSLEPCQLHRAMHYSVFNGGKRLRPLLVYATGAAVDADATLLDQAACAIELIHCYSLVHDDLPAMDDDTLRRGNPTCHIAFDEATAILAGDALQSLAFAVLSTGDTRHSAQRLAMLHKLAVASGSRGMAGGQSLDLQAQGKSIDLAYLEQMHRLKTGALIQASVELGALAAAKPLPPTLLTALQQFAAHAGYAFQIQDDILDIEGDSHLTGKETGKDHRHAKPTYPELTSLNDAKQKVQQLRAKALECLTGSSANTQRLRELMDYIIERNH